VIYEIAVICRCVGWFLVFCARRTNESGCFAECHWKSNLITGPVVSAIEMNKSNLANLNEHTRQKLQPHSKRSALHILQ